MNEQNKQSLIMKKNNLSYSQKKKIKNISTKINYFYLTGKFMKIMITSWVECHKNLYKIEQLLWMKRI